MSGSNRKKQNDSISFAKYLRILLAVQIVFGFCIAPALALDTQIEKSPTSVCQTASESGAVSPGWREAEEQEATGSDASDNALSKTGTLTDKSVVEQESEPQAGAVADKLTSDPPQTETPETPETENKVDAVAEQQSGSAPETTRQTASESADKPKEAQIVSTSATESEAEKPAESIVESSSGSLIGESSAEQKSGAKEGDELAFLEEGYVEKDEEIDVIVIDNDEAEIVCKTIAFEELPTDEAKTRIKTGAQFPVALVSQISSKTAKKGDVLQARLKYDLKIGDRLIAKKGSLVTGHVDYNMPARTVMHSLVSPHRWYRNSGCIGISFDEIINENSEHIALNAKPARKDRIVKNKAEGRLLGVNHDGQITGPWGQQLRYKAIRVGLNAAMAPAGVFSFGAMPVALGVMGAINPSFAFMRPVGTNEPHRRIKGFAWGFLSGIPGSWIIEDTVTKGQEALIRPGDEFLVELHQEFTGEVLTEAQLMPGASAKISGDVDDKRLEKTEKKGKFRLRKGKKK